MTKYGINPGTRLIRFLCSIQCRISIHLTYRVSPELLGDYYHYLGFVFPTFEAIDGCNHNHIEWLAERWGFLDRLPPDWRAPIPLSEEEEYYWMFGDDYPDYMPNEEDDDEAPW